MDISTFTSLLISGSFIFLSCAANQTGQNYEDLSIDEVAGLIDNEVGDATAGSIEVCEIIPIGAKPAGGPRGYLVYSSSETDPQKLQDLVRRYNELDAVRNKDSDAFSTADFATEPDLKIQDGRCFGEGQYAWNPGEVKQRT